MGMKFKQIGQKLKWFLYLIGILLICVHQASIETKGEIKTINLFNNGLSNISTVIELETNEEFMKRMSKRMKIRRRITIKACRKYGFGKLKFNKQLFMEAKRLKFLYCRIPKAGSTNMDRLFRELVDLNNYDQNKTRNRDINNPHTYEILTQRYFDDIKPLQKYTTFMITRDPFLRLVSSYRKKVAGKSGHRAINATWKSMKQVPANVSFSDFIAHVLYKDRKDNTLERHWALYYKLCQPCHIQYDVIANLETIEEDTRYLLNLVGAPKNISYSDGYGKEGNAATTIEQYKRYYSELPKQKRLDLYKMYEPDFRIFNYTTLFK